MQFDFDPVKSQANLAKHGINFLEAQELWAGDYVIIPAKNVLGENRFAILGLIGNRIHMGIFTQRADFTRIISCHRADKKWEKKYHEYIKKRDKKQKDFS